MSKPYRITIEQYDQKCSIELNHSDITLHEYKDLIKNISLASGWLPEQISEMFNED